jgi:hypothetical protein
MTPQRADPRGATRLDRSPFDRRRRHRRRRRQIQAIGCAGVVLVSVVYNVVVLSEQNAADATERALHLRLVGARATRVSIDARIAANGRSGDERRQALARTEAQINVAEDSLRSATATGTLQSLDLVTIKACVAGVTAASGAIQAGDLPGAINAIDTASPLCLSLDSASGPAYPFNFPDPSVLTVGNEYYAFATNSAAGSVQVIESSDLSHWTTLGDALPHLAIWAQPNNVWAPGVIQLGNRFLLYYSADFAATQEQCVSVAVATQPQGPYIDSTTWPIECQLDLGGSLDPSPFLDGKGVPYLTWKSQGAGSQPPALWSQRLSPDGTIPVDGTSAILLEPSQAWQGGVVEGPDMVFSGGQYRLFYSANSWRTPDYAVGVADCSGPSGPCAAAGNGPVLTSDNGFSGPGGPAVFTDVQGSMWVAFHAWLPGAVGFPNSRLLFLRLVTVTATGARIGP